MEEKVEYILKIITEDGDSFRTRAEQYYKKRPEIVNFIEDTFRGYRALAERYDHMSRDLQSANRTIAIMYPERVQMSFDKEDKDDFISDVDENENKLPTNSNVPVPLPLPPKQNNLPKVDNVVQAMLKKKATMPTKMMSKRGLIKIGVEENTSSVSKSSGLSKEEAFEEIEKLQKNILGFQTEKEFVKSLYEYALSKYREIESNINEMHTRISNLQQEFVVSAMIEDKDAQILMSSSALKMCEETLAKLKLKHRRFKNESVVEHKRVDEIRKNFEAIIASNNKNSDLKNLDQTVEHVKDKTARIEENQLKSFEDNGVLIQQDPHHCQNMENLDASPGTRRHENIDEKKARMKEEILGTNEDITISEVADKIEQLVDKVIALETEVTSQTALLMRLRLENDDLNEHLESLEQEKNILVDDLNSMNIKIKRLEEELERVEILDQKVKVQHVRLETRFEEASVNLDSLFKGLSIAKPDENTPENDVIFQKEKGNTSEFPNLEGSEDKGNEDKGNEDKGNEYKGNEDKINESNDSEGFVTKPNEKVECNDVESKDIDMEDKHHRVLTETVINNHVQDVDCIGDQKDEGNWNLVLSHEIDDREEMLIEEYTKTLRNYKEVKQKLNEIEKTNRARSFKSAVQMKILRNSNESKDLEIRSLYEKLKQFETNMEKTMDSEEKKATYLLDEEIQGMTRLDETQEFDQIRIVDLIDEVIERTQRENDEIDETTHYEIKKASDAIDEGTHRIEALVETAHFELQKARDLIGKGTQQTKENDEMTNYEQKKDPDSIDDGTQRSKELDETTNFELSDEETQRKKEDEMIDGDLKKAQDSVDERTQRSKELDETTNIELNEEETQRREKVDEMIYYEQKKTQDFVDEGTQSSKEIDETTNIELNDEGAERKTEIDEITDNEVKKARDVDDEGKQRRKEHGDGVDEVNGVLEVEEEIRMEIDNLRKENMELWLRFSTSFHQINRFQDSFNDLIQEIKEVNEKKNEHGNHKHHQHHSYAYGSDIRPLYRHLRDMQTEVILWLEKIGILDDDLQHRLGSLSDIQNELSDLTNGVSKAGKITTSLNEYQAAKFQGEVVNMKQENVKVLDELRVACERVKKLQIDIEKTLTKLDEELGKKKKSNSTKVPFKSFLFGAKLRRKHKRSIPTSMSPKLKKQYSNPEELPQPREDR